MNGPSMSDNRERDLVKEAQSIIDRYVTRLNRVSVRKKRRDSEKTLWFIAGITTSAALFFALLLKIY